jgi:hypothetical protein
MVIYNAIILINVHSGRGSEDQNPDRNVVGKIYCENKDTLGNQNT